MHQFWHLIQGGGDEPASILYDQVWRDIDHLKEHVPQDDILMFIPDEVAADYGADFLLRNLRKRLDQNAASFVVAPVIEDDESQGTTTWYIRGVAGDVEVFGYANFNKFGEVQPDSPLIATTEYKISKLEPRHPALYGPQVTTQAARIVGNHLTYLAATAKLTIEEQ